MPRILTIFALSFMLASSSAVVAGPASFDPVGDRSGGAERLNNKYSMYKRLYGRDRNKIREPRAIPQQSPTVIPDERGRSSAPVGSAPRRHDVET